MIGISLGTSFERNRAMPQAPRAGVVPPSRWMIFALIDTE